MIHGRRHKLWRTNIAYLTNHEGARHPLGQPDYLQTTFADSPGASRPGGRLHRTVDAAMPDNWLVLLSQSVGNGANSYKKMADLA